MKRRFATVALLLLFTEAVYIPLSVLRGDSVVWGWDYLFLHSQRLAFARDALWGAGHRLPGWYPHQLLGTPFAANLQNFPWIPTHLLLLLFDPNKTYAWGIAISAGLAALFTYLYCRRAGLSELGAAAAAWTFACAGYFAARITVGHLELLEGYLSLPLLLWLADRAVDHKGNRRDVVALAIGAACVVLAGHPQLPAYSVIAVLLYVTWRSWGDTKLLIKLGGAVACGIGMTMIAWWPMLLLIRRSTRALPLDPAPNDVVLPYHRLLGFVMPGIDGWPAGISRATGHWFTGYSDPAYFWETFGYMGILPLGAAAFLAVRCVVQRRIPSSRWLFLAVLGMAALLGALPLFEAPRQALHATIFRAPARLLYLCTFSLSAAFGAGVDAVLRWKPFGRVMLAQAAVLACLAFHAWDLGGISRLFVVPGPLHPLAIPEFDSILDQSKESRIAISRMLDLQVAYHRYDAGGFDAICLADNYRMLLTLTDAPPGLNQEGFDASTWPLRALQAAGVEFVMPWGSTPKGLELIKEARGVQLFRVPNPTPRSNGVAYLRPNSDLIEVRSAAVQAGAVHVLEAYDPGWVAEVDGNPAPVVESHGLGMEVPTPAGQHVVRLSYHTPGRKTGAVLSVVSACLFVLVVLL